VQRLVADGTWKAEVSTGSTEQVVVATEDCGDDRAEGWQVDQHLPSRPVQLASGHAHRPERVAVRAAVARAIGIDRHDFVDHLIATGLQHSHLLVGEHVGDDDKAVAAKDSHDRLDVTRFEDLEPADPVVRSEVVAEPTDRWIVTIAVSPAERRRAGIDRWGCEIVGHHTPVLLETQACLARSPLRP
jgi:hypothetical protein